MVEHNINIAMMERERERERKGQKGNKIFPWWGNIHSKFKNISFHILTKNYYYYYFIANLMNLEFNLM